MRDRCRHRICLPLMIVLAAVTGVTAATPASSSQTNKPSPQRPALMSNRWQEDWSVLADPRVPRAALDELKYLPFGDHADRYVSFGLNLRERFERNDSPGFATGGRRGDSYLLQRLQIHADVRLGSHVQVFTQLEDARAVGKTVIGPVDSNRLDLRQAFVAITGELAGGIYKIRAGRQEMGFDLQRFVSVRNGPNVRQAFDALWLDWEHGPWRIISFASQPVQYRSVRTFDDFSNRHLRFGGFRVERKGVGPGDLSLYYARYAHDNAHYPSAAGNERRNVYDLRYAGTGNGLDWDLEAMDQRGHVGTVAVRAWASGARVGYTSTNLPWQPRIGVQLDAASGDQHPGNGRLGTFNPLFPNGSYFTLGGYTGYVNLLHVEPSLTVHPASRLSVVTAFGLQWRQTVADAIYLQPNVPLAGTAGQGGRWTGAYGLLRLDLRINRQLSADMEVVHYHVGRAIRAAGGSDANYFELELNYGW